MKSAKDLKEKIDYLRRLNRERDAEWADVRAVRDGKTHLVFGDLMNEDWPKPIIANFINVAARDLAESVSPLPAFNCSSGTMVSDKARQRADMRTKIVQWYIQHSKLAVQMLDGADYYFSYGVCPIYIEPDMKRRVPRLCLEDPRGGYAECDRWGRVVSYTRVWQHERAVLASLFPDHAGQILGDPRQVGRESVVDVARYCDDEEITLVLLDREPVVLHSGPNVLGETPVVLARLRNGSDVTRGQFGDILWVQLARDYMAKLAIEGAEKSIRAPIVTDVSVQNITYGPDARIVSSAPEKIRRLEVPIPQAAFAEGQVLAEEMRRGSRYPEARGGNIDASIITGQGVEALMSGYSTQLKAAQTVLEGALTDAVSLCLRMDEKLWPNMERTIRGQQDGAPFEAKYKPSRDIAGDHTVEVSYGFASGLDPNRALVAMLQAQAVGALSVDTLSRNMPWGINVTEEQRKVDVEKTRDAIKQGLFAYVQAIPVLAQQGQDPSQILTQSATIIKAVQKGTPIEEAIAEAFKPEPPPETAGVGEQPEAGMSPQSGGGPGEDTPAGLHPSGLPLGVAPGQAGQAPGGRPDLSVMLAGLSPSGKPMMTQTTMRRRRV